MKLVKVWLLLALVFVAGFAGGVVVTRVAVRHFVSQAIEDPGLVRTRIERLLVRNLDLDREQRRQVHEILMQSNARLRTLRQSVQPEFRTIIQDTRKDISAVLKPDQQKRFQRLQARTRRFWQLN